MQEFNGTEYDILYPQIIPNFNQDVNLNSNRILNVAAPQNNTDAVNKKYVDDSTALIYSDWVTFEHSVSNFVVSPTNIYDYNIKDINGNENYEEGHSFIQIQASETFYSDNVASLNLYSVNGSHSYVGFIFDSHNGGENTQKSGNLESFSDYARKLYILVIGNSLYSGKTICRMKIASNRSAGSLCNVTVTGKYRYIDFKT